MRTNHKIFIAILVLQEQTTIKVSLQDLASNSSYEKDKINQYLCTSNTNQILQQKLATNTYHIMVLLHRALQEDSKTSKFTFF